MSKFSIKERDDAQIDNNGRAKFIIFGVGGAGGNAVEHMVTQNLKLSNESRSKMNDITFVCANTDLQALNSLSVDTKLQLGVKTNRGLGAGANPEVGREVAEADEGEIREILTGADLVFITAGMGGGTGTGAAPVVARIAKEMGILTVAVVTLPFRFEGGRRMKQAKEGVAELEKHVDSIMTIPNDKLLKVYSNLTMKDAFKKADDVLLDAVQALSDTIGRGGVMNIDFQDVTTTLSVRGHSMMGIGRAGGDGRAIAAAEKAIQSPLLDDLVLENAAGVIVNIVASETLMMSEMDAISDVISRIANLDEGQIFTGFVEDPEMGDDICVTIIATGLQVDENRSKPAPTPTQTVIQPVSAPRPVHIEPEPVAPPKPKTKPSMIQDYLKNHQK